MNLRPDLRKPLLHAWLTLGGMTAVCLGCVYWLSDAGEVPQQIETAAAEQLKLKGTVDLQRRITQQKDANENLHKTVVQLKAATGFVPISPFIVPPNTPQPGQYFNEQLAAVQDFCRPKAFSKSIVYQERLGFENTAKVPRDEDAPYLLAMLQLTRKAADIILSTPTPVEKFQITQPSRTSILTGPTGRPPLLREYPLRLEVRASLTDLLWILHTLAKSDSAGDYPLVVRGWRIDSKNINPKDEIQQLDAVFEVAAMRFLTDEERATIGKNPTPTTGRGL